MSIKKTTEIKHHQRVHIWTDTEVPFVATVVKTQPGWDADIDGNSRIFEHYQNAVDWLMDEYRLAKSPKNSWEEMGAEMAGDMGMVWEDLPDDTQQDFIDSARQMARFLQ